LHLYLENSKQQRNVSFIVGVELLRRGYKVSVGRVGERETMRVSPQLRSRSG
jgi:hypothetical protein